MTKLLIILNILAIIAAVYLDSKDPDTQKIPVRFACALGGSVVGWVGYMLVVGI